MTKWTVRQWYWLVLAGMCVLSLLHLGDYLVGRPSWQLTRAVFMGFDANVATWYSSVVFLSAAIVTFRCYRRCTELELLPRYGWVLVTLLLLLMSCDETAKLHENWGGFLAARFGGSLRGAWQHSGWPIVLGPILIAAGAAMVVIMRRHLRGSRTSALLLLWGVGLILGCGVVLESTINYMTHEEHQVLWEIEIWIEETGEMLGGWLLGYGALAHTAHVDRVATS